MSPPSGTGACFRFRLSLDGPPLVPSDAAVVPSFSWLELEDEGLNTLRRVCCLDVFPESKSAPAHVVDIGNGPS